MKKRLIILIIILLILAGGVGGMYVYLMETTKPVFHKELSGRSKEFLSSQAGEKDSEFRGVDMDKKHAGEHDYDSNRVIVKDCYSLVVPFEIADDRQNDPCVYYAILASPRGNMTTSLRTVGFTKAEDAPDVTLRRSHKETYKESALTVNNVHYIVFSDVTTGVEKTAFGMQGAKLFTVSLGIGGDEELKTRQLQKILGSVEVEK